ncbi:hypothetical protein [Methylibium sp.]|uniref:hypothetical protein n=1 Tax=Methylibium sp. TaxID=2067992 RepID=UPI003D13F80C
MNPNPTQLDIVTVAVALAAVLFTSDTAGYIGPYIVIALAAVLGGFWSATQRPPGTRLGVLGLLLGTLVLALLVTVPIAEVAAQRFGTHMYYWLAPVALVIGGIGSRWPLVFLWGLGLGKRVVEAMVDAFSRAKGGQP